MVSLHDDELIAHEVRLGKPFELDRVRLSSLDPAGQRIAFRNVLAKRQSGSNEDVRLCLDAVQCLSKRISLPIATEENLRAVLGFEMDRHTPFKAEKVYYDYRVSRRDVKQGLIEVELTLAPKLPVDALVLRIEGMGGRVTSAVFIDDLLKPAPYPDLLKQIPKSRSAESSTRKLNLALTGALLLLLGVIVVIPIWQKRTAAIALLPQLGQAKGEAEAAEAVHKNLEKLVLESNYIVARKHSQPSSLSLVEDLSRVLSDTTWVQFLEMKSSAKSREVVLTGETASASKLIETIEQTGSLQNASFRSPLTKGQSPSSERFVLGAEVKSRPLPPPIPDSELSASTPTPATINASPPALPASATPKQPADAKPAIVPRADPLPPSPLSPSGTVAPASKN